MFRYISFVIISNACNPNLLSNLIFVLFFHFKDRQNEKMRKKCRIPETDAGETTRTTTRAIAKTTTASTTDHCRGAATSLPSAHHARLG